MKVLTRRSVAEDGELLVLRREPASKVVAVQAEASHHIEHPNIVSNLLCRDEATVRSVAGENEGDATLSGEVM